MPKVLKKELEKYPKYIIYSDGRIYSKKSEKFLSQSKSNGYYAVSLKSDKIKKKRINVRIHVLVAKAHVENKKPEKNIVVDHVNGNKLDNNYTNLQWTTVQKNSKKSDLTKNNNVIVCQYSLDKKHLKEFSSIAKASKKTGTSSDMIQKCCAFKCKTAKDGEDNRYIWKYKKAKEVVDEPDGKIIKNLSKYIILKSGKVYSKASKKYIKLGANNDGYIRINLTNDKGVKKNYQIHRLVMWAYKGKSDKQVNHINNIRTDNRLKNLEYVTAQENLIHSYKYGGNNKLIKKVVQIDMKTNKKIKTFSSSKDAAEELNIPVVSIRSVCGGFKKTACGFKWKYAESK